MPVLFYMPVYGMIVWPVSIAEVPNICGALICVFLLMGFYYVSLIIGIAQSRNEAEKINASALMEKYTEGILHEARTVRNHQKLLAIQRHDLRHQYALIKSLLDEGQYDGIYQLLEKSGQQLENAFIAVCKVPDSKERKVSVRIEPKKGQLIIEIRNNYFGKLDISRETGLPAAEEPAETATKAQFSGAVDNATANVTLLQPISDKAVFVARQYSMDSDYFVNNAEAAVSQWVENNGLTVLDAIAYDMHFEENGQEISVCQPANVSLAFNSPILTMTGDAVAPTESSSDLSNFVTSAILNGAEWNDNTTILPDTDYTIKLTFGENPESMQFNTAGEREYTLPDALLNSWLASAQEFDLKKDTSASISVTKNLKTVAGENIYAVDQTFYVALYEDENCIKLASKIKALTFKNSTSETVTFEGVEPNKTYYVGECTKDGVRYLSGVVAGTKYVARFTDGNKVTVEIPNGSKAVYFDNRFMKFPDGFYKEGVLSITKLFKDSTD